MSLLKELEELAPREYVDTYYIALVHAALGEKDMALGWLEKAFEARSSFLTWIKVEPKLNSLHSAARFQSLLRRMNLPTD